MRKAIRCAAQAACSAIGIEGVAHDEQIGSQRLDRPIDQAPVDGALLDAHDAMWGGGATYGVAGGDADATQTEIEGENDLGSRLRHGPRTD